MPANYASMESLDFQGRQPANRLHWSSTSPLVIKPRRRRRKIVIIAVLVILAIISLGLGLGIGLRNSVDFDDLKDDIKDHVEDHIDNINKLFDKSKPSGDDKDVNHHQSDVGDAGKPPPVPVPVISNATYERAAVSSDAQECSNIGKDLLAKNGSAVDAAIATLLCAGLFVPHSMGIGGGFFMTVYSKKNGTAYVINGRERAPLNATVNMYNGNATLSQTGALSVGVPGEIRGYWEAHQRFGQLSWKEIFEPVIALLKRGINIRPALANALQQQKENITNDPGLREIFFNETTQDVLKVNETYFNPQLVDTFSKIAEKGADVLYNGELGKILVKELTKMGGIISEADMSSYRPSVDVPTTVELNDGTRVFSVPPPGSGILLGFILHILDGYDFNETSTANTENSILTYHRIAEAFRYAYAQRTLMGDIEYVNMTQLLSKLTNTTFADLIRSNIADNTTFAPQHYGGIFTKQDHGTSHVSVYAANGDAVSATSTINLYFGARIRSLETGIILNDEMDDFSSPNVTNYFGVPPSSANFIEPGKRPLSSMCPSVVVDSNGTVVMVVGAAGGTRITTATALTIMRRLWFNNDIINATAFPRIHDQLEPNSILYEKNFPQDVLDGLVKLGHSVRTSGSTFAVVNVIARTSDGKMTAYADWRKKGGVNGM